METRKIGLLCVEDRQEMVELIDSLISNPPGLNGVDTDKGRVGNKHVDIGWVAGLERLKSMILAEAIENHSGIGEGKFSPSLEFRGTNQVVTMDSITNIYKYPVPLTDICGRGKPVGFPERRIIHLQSKVNEYCIYMPAGNQYQLFAILVYLDIDYYYMGISDGMAFYSTIEMVRESCPCGDYGRPGHPIGWCDANVERYNGVLAGGV